MFIFPSQELKQGNAPKEKSSFGFTRDDSGNLTLSQPSKKTTTTPTYFTGGNYGAATSTDISGRPFAKVPVQLPKTYLNPASTVSVVDSRRVATTFDPTIAKPLPAVVLKNPRMSQAASVAIKTALNGGSTTELDHVIALGLSGSNDLNNLKIQPGIKGGAASKSDALENSLISQVKLGAISLSEAQRQLAKNKGITLPENQKTSKFDSFMMNTPGLTKPLAAIQNAIQHPIATIKGTAISAIVKQAVVTANSQIANQTAQENLKRAKQGLPLIKTPSQNASEAYQNTVRQFKMTPTQQVANSQNNEWLISGIDKTIGIKYQPKRVVINTNQNEPPIRTNELAPAPSKADKTNYVIGQMIGYYALNKVVGGLVSKGVSKLPFGEQLAEKMALRPWSVGLPVKAGLSATIGAGVGVITQADTIKQRLQNTAKMAGEYALFSVIFSGVENLFSPRITKPGTIIGINTDTKNQINAGNKIIGTIKKGEPQYYSSPNNPTEIIKVTRGEVIFGNRVILRASGDLPANITGTEIKPFTSEVVKIEGFKVNPSLYDHLKDFIMGKATIQPINVPITPTPTELLGNGIIIPSTNPVVPNTPVAPVIPNTPVPVSPAPVSPTVPTVPVATPNIPTATPVTPTTPLDTEALKYNSADEFVGAILGGKISEPKLKEMGFEIPSKGRLINPQGMELSDIWNKAHEGQVTQPTQTAPITQPTPTAGTKISGVAKSIEAKAIEQGLIEKGYDTLAEYSGSTLKAQAELGSQYTIPQHIAFMRGEEPLPTGMRPGTVKSIIEDYALTTNDGALNKELANSTVVSQLSEAASIVSLNRTGGKASAVDTIIELNKELEKSAMKRMHHKPVANVKSEIKDGLKTAIQKSGPNKYSWTNLIDEIIC